MLTYIQNSTKYQLWGKYFANLRQIAADPKCEVTLRRLWQHLKNGQPLEDAVKNQRSGYYVWGQRFLTLEKLAADTRCKLTLNKLKKYHNKGLNIPFILEQGIRQIIEYKSQIFYGFYELSKSQYCEVHYATLVARIKNGISIHRALKKKPLKYSYRVWGQKFSSLKDVANDPRCEVSLTYLQEKIKRGRSIRHAVLAYKHPPYIIWGEHFNSLREIVDDPRCSLNYDDLLFYSHIMKLSQAVKCPPRTLQTRT